MTNALDKFKIKGKVVVVTGGSGLMGAKHVEAIIEAGGCPVIWDVHKNADLIEVNVSDETSVKNALRDTLRRYCKVDVLINNAANNPHATSSSEWGELESFNIDSWNKDISVGLTGSFLCSKIIGSYMAGKGGGVILNVASDLGVIAPDQRIYKDKNKKPVSYSVVKHGLIGLTKYLATYWADKNIRVNSISPGGIFQNQDEEFVKKLTNLIPMGRMANEDEYKAAVLFLISDASSYMTGANLIIDGGRTCW